MLLVYSDIWSMLVIAPILPFFASTYFSYILYLLVVPCWIYLAVHGGSLVLESPWSCHVSLGTIISLRFSLSFAYLLILTIYTNLSSSSIHSLFFTPQYIKSLHDGFYIYLYRYCHCLFDNFL